MADDSSASVVLFDGVCNLCNGSVNFFLSIDRRKRLKFASLQSNFGQSTLVELGKDTTCFDSILFLHQGKVYERSGAVLRIMGRIGGIWSLAVCFLVAPAFLRDACYNLIARNRYRFFGKSDTCRIPTPEEAERFME